MPRPVSNGTRLSEEARKGWPGSSAASPRNPRELWARCTRPQPPRQSSGLNLVPFRPASPENPHDEHDFPRDPQDRLAGGKPRRLAAARGARSWRRFFAGVGGSSRRRLRPGRRAGMRPTGRGGSRPRRAEDHRPRSAAGRWRQRGRAGVAEPPGVRGVAGQDRARFWRRTERQVGGVSRREHRFPPDCRRQRRTGHDVRPVRVHRAVPGRGPAVLLGLAPAAAAPNAGVGRGETRFRRADVPVPRLVHQRRGPADRVAGKWRSTAY